MVYHKGVNLKPLDVLVVLKISVLNEAIASYASLASSLGVSASQVHSAVRRAQSAHLINRSLIVRKWDTYHMLAYGVRYFIPAVEGAESRGMPTSYGADPLKRLFGEFDRVPVWPVLEGNARGPSIEPIYQTVPLAAKHDEALYALLTLVDAIRVGRMRERKAGRVELARFFGVDE